MELYAKNVFHFHILSFFWVLNMIYQMH